MEYRAGGSSPTARQPSLPTCAGFPRCPCLLGASPSCNAPQMWGGERSSYRPAAPCGKSEASWRIRLEENGWGTRRAEASQEGTAGSLPRATTAVRQRSSLFSYCQVLAGRGSNAKKEMAEENIETEVPNPEGLAPGTLGPCSNWPGRFAPPTLFPKWSQELLSPSWKDTLRSPYA